MIATEPRVPAELAYHEKKHILTAAFYALNLGLGPIGEMAAREIQDWANFGYRLGHDSVVMRTVKQMHEMWKAREEGRVA